MREREDVYIRTNSYIPVFKIQNSNFCKRVEQIVFVIEFAYMSVRTDRQTIMLMLRLKSHSVTFLALYQIRL